MIIDSHSHLPILKEKSSFEEAKKKLLRDMKKDNIYYTIIIPDNIPCSRIGDLDTNLSLISNEQNLFLMGTLNILKDRTSVIKKLDKLFKNNKIVAIKIFPGHDPHYPTDKRLIPVYKLCIKYDLPIVIHTGRNSNHPEVAKYNDPKHIIKIAKRYPKLKIVITHYFWPEIEYCYNITRPYKNIYFDTSALADKEVIKESRLGKIKSILEKTIKDNPESVLFGTDYGICTFRSHINLINSLKISKEEKEMVFYRNAIKLFKLKI